MKLLCLLFAVLIIPKIASAQFMGGSDHFKGDSVIIYVDNRVEINIAVPDYERLKSGEEVAEMLRSFMTLLPGISNRLIADEADLITYTAGNELTVEPGDRKFVYQFKDGELVPTGYRDRAILKGSSFTVFITASDLSRIGDLSLPDCFDQVTAMLPSRSNWSRSLYYECLNGKVNALKNLNATHDVDMLELNLSAGAGLIKNKWIPDLTFMAGLGFNRKGLLKYNPYLSSTFVFDFSTENKLYLNTFLNLGFRWNIGNDTYKPDLFGLEVGYLISKKGELFGNHTFRLGFNLNPLKKVFLSPQVYMTDDFGTFYPGLRIGVGF